MYMCATGTSQSGIVERAGAKVDDLLAPCPVAIEPAAAIAAKPGYDRNPHRRSVAPSLRLSLPDMKILARTGMLSANALPEAVWQFVQLQV